MRRALLAAVVLSLLAAAPAVAAPALTSVGIVRAPGPRRRAPRATRGCSWWRRPGRVQVVANGAARPPFLDVTGVVDASGERAGAALDRLRARLRGERAVLRLLHRRRRRPRGPRGDADGRPEPRRSSGGSLFTSPHAGPTTTTAASSRSGRTARSTRAPATAAARATRRTTRRDPASLLGKILRIDPRRRRGPQIWALGLRNPWRFSFDRATGDMVIGDVGGAVNEEIDFAPAGAPAGRNYGWAALRGQRRQLPGAARSAGAQPAARGAATRA